AAAPGQLLAVVKLGIRCPFPQLCTKSSIDPLYLNSPLSLTTTDTRPTVSSVVRGNSTNVRLLGIILIEPMFYKLAAEFSRLRSVGIAQDIERMREYAYDTHTTGQANRDHVQVRD